MPAFACLRLPSPRALLVKEQGGGGGGGGLSFSMAYSIAILLLYASLSGVLRLGVAQSPSSLLPGMRAANKTQQSLTKGRGGKRENKLNRKEAKQLTLRFQFRSCSLDIAS